MLGISTTNARVGGFRGGKKFSAQYQAILAEGTAQGYTLPSAGQQVKQNILMAALVSSGVLAKVDILYVFANDGSKEFACINWKNPSGAKATLISSPTFTANAGITGNGTSSYIDTNYNPTGAGNYLLNNASRYVYVKTAIANKIIDGIDGSGANSITTFAGVVNRINQSGANTAATIDLSGVGMKSIHRTSSTVVTAFNNTTQTNTTATSTGYSNMNQFILRSNAVYTNHEVSFYAMGASMVSENSALVSAFATYINSL
jgi:hypothetical protein